LTLLGPVVPAFGLHQPWLQLLPGFTWWKCFHWHALGLAVPLVVAVSTSLTAQNGLLISDRAAFERARGLNAVIFKKFSQIAR
jgi:hypothetical protein